MAWTFLLIVSVFEIIPALTRASVLESVGSLTRANRWRGNNCFYSNGCIRESAQAYIFFAEC